MNKIEPAYVSFEQAKSLKEKGFNIITRTAYDFKTYQPSNIYEENLEIIPNAKNYSNSEYKRYPRPEQWQVVEWLRLNHGIWVYASPYYSRPDDNKTGKWIFEGFEPEVYFIKELEVGEEISTTFFLATYEHPQKAYSAAFDYILKELI
jgi:hypothetical protein